MEEEFYQVWRIDHLNLLTWAEPVSQPMTLEDAKVLAENLAVAAIERCLAQFGYEPDCSFEVKKVHPEERF
jgi:hypothetical protein